MSVKKYTGAKKDELRTNKRLCDDVDEALEQTFPASDPASYTTPHAPERPIK